MYLGQSLYPVVLAHLNVALGWSLYYLRDSLLGVVLVGVGLLVLLSMLGRTVTEHRPERNRFV